MLFMIWYDLCVCNARHSFCSNFIGSICLSVGSGTKENERKIGYFDTLCLKADGNSIQKIEEFFINFYTYYTNILPYNVDNIRVVERDSSH